MCSSQPCSPAAVMSPCGTPQRATTAAVLLRAHVSLVQYCCEYSAAQGSSYRPHDAPSFSIRVLYASFDFFTSYVGLLRARLVRLGHPQMFTLEGSTLERCGSGQRRSPAAPLLTLARISEHSYSLSTCARTFSAHAATRCRFLSAWIERNARCAVDNRRRALLAWRVDIYDERVAI